MKGVQTLAGQECAQVLEQTAVWLDAAGDGLGCTGVEVRRDKTHGLPSALLTLAVAKPVLGHLSQQPITDSYASGQLRFTYEDAAPYSRRKVTIPEASTAVQALAAAAIRLPAVHRVRYYTEPYALCLGKAGSSLEIEYANPANGWDPEDLSEFWEWLQDAGTRPNEADFEDHRVWVSDREEDGTVKWAFVVKLIANKQSKNPEI